MVATAKLGVSTNGYRRHMAEQRSSDALWLIRRYQPADRDAVAEICLRTAASGADATGHYSDDSLMPDVWAMPYLEYAPELAFVVARSDAPDHPLGYVLAAADTAAFIEWWNGVWGPEFAARHPKPGAPTGANPAFTETALIQAGREPERMRIAELDDYPAHLHIDLLPEAQGQGLGRRLIDRLCAELAARGVPGVHLQVGPSNLGARAFYARLGFEALPSNRPDAPVLGRSFR